MILEKIRMTSILTNIINIKVIWTVLSGMATYET